MSHEHTAPPHKSYTNALNTAFPAFFGRDEPKLGINKSTDFDPDTFQRRSLATQQHDPAHTQLHDNVATALESHKPHAHAHDRERNPNHVRHPSTMPRRTPEEEEAYMAALAEWARDKDAMHAGDGTFGPTRRWAAANAGSSQGMMIGAVSDDQMQRDTTVRRKDGTWDVPPNKGSDVGFVGTWKRRLSSPFGKDRRASADARAADWARDHDDEQFPQHGPVYEHEHHEHHDPISRLKDEE